MRVDIKERIELIKRGEVPKEYKKTKIGIIPKEWEIHKLEELSTKIGSGKTPRGGSRVYEKNGIIFIRSQNVLNEKLNLDDVVYISSALDDTMQSTRVQEGDVLLNITGASIGRSCVVPEAFPGGNVNQHVCIIRTNDSIESSYLVSQLLCEEIGKKQIDSMQTGGNREGLNFQQIGAMKIILPEKEEQIKIQNILNLYTEKVKKMEALIWNYEQRKKWIIQTLLTGKKRIGPVKKDWKKIKVGEVLQEGSKERVSDLKAYKKITIKLNFGGIDFFETNREMADTRPFYVRHEGEIIIGKQNYFNGSIALIDEKYNGTICSNAIMSFSVREECCDKHFLFYYLSQPDYIKKKSFMANGTGQKELSEKDFLNFDIMLPDISEQKAIANILITADKEIKLLEKKLEQIKLEKKAMMQLLLTGIVRVG